MNKKLLFILMSLILCFSLCACAGYVYNSNTTKDGFLDVNSITGITFAIPNELQKDVLSEMDLLSLTLDDGSEKTTEEIKKLENSIFEVKDTNSYILFKYSEFYIKVCPISVDKSIKDIKNGEELSNILASNKIKNISPEKKITKHSEKDNSKIICETTFTIGKEDGISKDYKYFGYTALIENENQNRYMMLVGFVNEDNNSKYIAKSLKFTEEAISPTEVNEEIKTPDETINTEVIQSFEAKLTDFKLLIDGKTITLPMKTSDFLTQLELSIPEDDMNAKLKNNEYTSFGVKNGSKFLYIHVVNTTGKDDVNVKDCSVYTISADKYDIYGYGDNLTPHISIVLPCNVIIAKTTYDEVVAAYGKPTEEKNNEDSDFIYLTWNLGKLENDKYTHMKIAIEKKSNLVYDFEYGNMPI